MIKKVGKSYYAHYSNLDELLINLSEKEQKNLLNVLKKAGNLGITYVIIKYNRLNNNVSLIKCDTWDLLNEPIVGDSYCFNYLSDFYKIIKGGSKVYHNKWQFVSSDYMGFNLIESMERTKLWNSYPEIVKNKSKIGNKEYWYSILKKYGLNI